MVKTVVHIHILLLTITFLTVTEGQYYDILQGLSQLFQPYQPQNDYFPQYNVNQRPPQRQQNRDHKKKTEDRNVIKNTPIYQYDYVFSTTTTKPSRKTTKPNSSHSNKQNSNRNYNTDILFNDYSAFEITTKRNRVTTNNRKTTAKASSVRTTTTRPNNKKSTTVRPTSKKTTTARPRVTTENVLSGISFNYGSNNNYNRPVTENVSLQKDVKVNSYQTNSNQNTRRPDNTGNLQQNTRKPDNKNVDNSSNNNKPTNTRNPNVQNINLSTQQNSFLKPTNNRNPNVNPINSQNRGTQLNRTPNSALISSFVSSDYNSNNFNNRGTQNNRNPNYGLQTSGFINTGNNNNNFNDRVTGINYGNNYNNDRVVLNTDYGFNNNRGNGYPNTVIYQPGVKPDIIDPNQVPITNRPVPDRNNFVPFDRPDDSFGTFTEKPSGVPEILIGPDEDDMSERQKRRYIETAEKMCDRYKNLNVKEVVALPLLPSPDPVELNVTTCAPITVPLVIGGTVVSINEFPHMALVGWRKIRANGHSWKCGGSLISNLYVLSAGHCTYQDKDYDVESGPPQAVQLGSSYLDDPKAVVVPISAVIRHPKYKQRRSYYDIALIKMARTVTFSETIRPACLGVPPPVGDSIIATGWGRTEFGGDHSVELRSVSLPVWNMAQCREIWGTSLKLPNGPNTDSHMCAGEKDGGKDTCQGDSGGPAQIQDGCVWRVVAVTSFGRSCGAPNTPALYAVTRRAFIAAQVFGDQAEQGNGNGNQNTNGYDDRRQPSYDNRQPSYNNRQPSFNDRPSYTVNNYRRQ